MTKPNLKPIQLREHTCTQGHYVDIVPKLIHHLLYQDSVRKDIM